MLHRVFLALAILACAPLYSYASETNGTIDTSFKYTRVCTDGTCSTYSTVNWAPTINGSTPGASAVAIADTGITGNAWGDSIGWINFKPTGYGVTVNATTGALGGYAYANTGGWINFSPTGYGVTINSSGQFNGWAWVSGPNGGWMRFDCTVPATCIKTDWRPIGSRSPTPTPTPPGNGPPLPPSGPIPPTTPPTTPPTVPVPTPTPVPTPLPGGGGSPTPEPPPTVPLPPPPVGGNGMPDYDKLKLINGSAKKPEGLPEVDLDLSTLTTNEPVFYTRSGSVQLFTPLRTVRTNDSGKKEQLQGKFLEVPVSSNVRVFIPTAADPVEVSTKFRYLGENDQGDDQKTIYHGDSVWDSFWYRVKKFILLAIESVFPTALAADTNLPNIVYEDYVVVPERPGIYQMYVTLQYPAGKQDTISNYGVVVTGGKVFYKEALFSSSEIPVHNAKVTLLTLDQKTKQQTVWRDKNDDALNPIATDQNGLYAFEVPSGVYATVIEAPGFDKYVGAPLGVTSGQQVLNDNIELICRPWSSLYCQWDTKLVALFVITIMGVIAYVLPRKRSQPMMVPQIAKK